MSEAPDEAHSSHKMGHLVLGAALVAIAAGGLFFLLDRQGPNGPARPITIATADQAGWAITRNLVEAKEAPNYLDAIYLPAMTAVKPEGVTIIH